MVLTLAHVGLTAIGAVNGHRVRDIVGLIEWRDGHRGDVCHLRVHLAVSGVPVPPIVRVAVPTTQGVNE